MTTGKRLSVVASLVFATCAHGQNVWLPGAGEWIIAPGYTHQFFDEFWLGKQKTDLPAKIVQQTGYIASEYGITAKLALDGAIGYTRVSFDPPGASFHRAGLDDSRIGLRYRVLEENQNQHRGVPAVALRVGAIIAGDYDVPSTLPPLNPGDKASGGEVSLMIGKHLTPGGLGVYSEVGYRNRNHGVPDDLAGTVGLFQHWHSVTFTGAYRHEQGLSGPDILGPGFGTTYGFPQVKEISRSIEGAISFTDPGGRSYQITVAKTLSGRNTGDKWIFGFNASFPLRFHSRTQE